MYQACVRHMDASGLCRTHRRIRHRRAAYLHLGDGIRERRLEHLELERAGRVARLAHLNVVIGVQAARSESTKLNQPYSPFLRVDTRSSPVFFCVFSTASTKTCAVLGIWGKRARSRPVPGTSVGCRRNCVPECSGRRPGARSTRPTRSSRAARRRP